MSMFFSALLCGIVWTLAMLYLAAPIGAANIAIALIAGVLAGAIWYEERIQRRAMKERDEWMRGGTRPYAR